MDRRIRKTKQNIQNSFLTLLKTTNLSKITVTDICTHADINRCTFYAHYKDVWDLYDTMKAELAEEFLSALDLYHFDMDSAEAITHIFHCIKEHKQLFLLMASSNNPNEALSIISDEMKEHILEIWKKESSLTHEEADMLFTFITVGGNAILLKWVQSNFSMPEDQMKYLFENVIKYGLYNFVYTK